MQQDVYGALDFDNHSTGGMSFSADAGILPPQ